MYAKYEGKKTKNVICKFKSRDLSNCVQRFTTPFYQRYFRLQQFLTTVYAPESTIHRIQINYKILVYLHRYIIMYVILLL